MRRSKKEGTESTDITDVLMPRGFGEMGYLWHALTRLRAFHPDQVGNLEPFKAPEALLSITDAYDSLFTARVEISGTQTTSDLHDMISTATRGIAINPQDIDVSGFTLEIRITKRYELVLHIGHVEGLTRLLNNALSDIAARDTPEGPRCSHCKGSGIPWPLWRAMEGQAERGNRASRPERRLAPLPLCAAPLSVRLLEQG
ncbi:hypothetical protein ACFQ61_03730 [Streptomyces sp. NPDC056500]|uniref:hypothetical protein n=1 Tax=Streptomyces sp. NPDC056500 TaxID=3345840 RepID=UPI00368BAF53